MNVARHATLFRLAVAVTLLAIAAMAADKVEPIGPPTSGIPDAIRQAVEEKGFRVTLDKGWIAEFWFTKDLATTKKDVPGALYPELTDGEFVGAVNLPQGTTDFRGQKIPAGTYTLRYQLLPQDGNHLGVAPNPDFLLAIPAASDLHPEQVYAYKKLVALSGKSTGGSHPAVIALESAGQPATVTKTEPGIVFSVAVPSAGGSENIGICLHCAASQ